MLRSVKGLERYKVSGTDGDIGSVVDFLIDDARWAIRYLVVNTGGFFSGRRVLVTPVSFREVDFSDQSFRLSLTMDKVRSSPSVDLDVPVSRQHERDYYGYYGYPYYWRGAGVWGMGDYPGAMTQPAYEAPAHEDRPGEPAGDPHLRSAREVTGYHIEGTDGAIGHIADFVVDEETWQVRYMVVATTTWLPGKRVLVAPRLTTRISWADRRAYVGLSRDAIKASPEWTGTYPIERDYEEQLANHYGGIPGWSSLDRSFDVATTLRS